MFGTLRPGSYMYILNKGENPSFTVGQVLNVTPPQQKINQKTFQVEQVVDISVKVGDDTKEFKNVNVATSIADTGAGGYLISDDKMIITKEVEAFLSYSQNVLNSVPYHQKVVESGKQMMMQLNPNLQKEEERNNEFAQMRAEMTEMRNMMMGFANLLKGSNMVPGSEERKEQ